MADASATLNLVSCEEASPSTISPLAGKRAVWGKLQENSRGGRTLGDSRNPFRTAWDSGRTPGDSQNPFRAALRRELGFMKASIAAMGSNAATILAADSFYRAIAPDVVIASDLRNRR